MKVFDMVRCGAWFMHKYRAQARESGYFNAARNLRKQGVPIEVALTLLLGKKTTLDKA